MSSAVRRAAFDEGRLDDADTLAALDPGDMLRTIAASGAQVREALAAANEARIDRIAEDGRPRAVVVAGIGGSGISGDVLAAIAGPGCPVPVVTHRGYGLPGWVGAADMVIGVSCSGTTEETLSAMEIAVGRGCAIAGVGGADSPLADLVGRGRGPYVPVPPGRMPRASLWALSVPLIVAGRALGLLKCTDEDLEAAAARLEDIADRCRPGRESFVNPGKQLAVELAGTLPMVWGTSPLAGTAAYRFAGQLAENAKYPAISGVLPEANHNQVVTLDGPFGRMVTGDLFDDPGEETALRLVVLADSDEHPRVARRRECSVELAAERHVPVTQLDTEGSSAIERFASLVGLVDFASAYLGLGYGLDPTPIHAIFELKERILRPAGP
jgi:glucose/mannose-6-phosphate isomerase